MIWMIYIVDPAAFLQKQPWCLQGWCTSNSEDAEGLVGDEGMAVPSFKAFK